MDKNAELGIVKPLHTRCLGSISLGLLRHDSGRPAAAREKDRKDKLVHIFIV